MRVRLTSSEGEFDLIFEEPVTITEAIRKAGIHPSTVLAVHQGVTIPQTTIINADVELELIIVSSGG